MLPATDSQAERIAAGKGHALLFKRMQIARFAAHLRKALWLALEHDVLNTAKAAAYSGMLMLFPSLIVAATLLALVPEANRFVAEMRAAFDPLVPAGSLELLQSYMQGSRMLSLQLILSAASLSVFAGLGLMLSLMDGFRRAYRLPRHDWGFWQRRMRALMLVPIVLVPLALASMVLVFGRQIEDWMISGSSHELRLVVLVGWRLLRWAVALVTSVTVLAALYHFGTTRGEHWVWVMPGAIAATVIWFPTTLAFGMYVTRIADYSMFYGPFGAGIATLVWLYITLFSALLGAELNGVLFRERKQASEGEEPSLPAS